MNLLLPDPASKVCQKQEQKQEQQKRNHDVLATPREFIVGDTVNFQNFAASGSHWIPCVIYKKTGTVSYGIQLLNASIIHCHIHHLIHQTSSSPTLESSMNELEFRSTTPAIKHQPCRYPTRHRNSPDWYVPSS